MEFIGFLGRNLRWLAGGFLLCFFSSFGQTFFISLSNGDIRREYGLSNGSFGLLYMAGTLLSAATLPTLGWLLDRYPAWRVAFVTILCLAGATLTMAFSNSVPLLFVSIYLLRLFGQGMMTEIAMTATGRWFAANRGRAMAITSLGFHAGTGLLPLVFVVAAAAFGWRGTWIASAASFSSSPCRRSPTRRCGARPAVRGEGGSGAEGPGLDAARGDARARSSG